MKIILIGGGGNLKSILASNTCNKNVEFLGYTDIIDRGDILGLKYLGSEKNIDLTNKNVVITISYLENPKERNLRIHLIKSLESNKAIFPNLVSPGCIIKSDIQNTKGNLFINSCFINTGVKIGNFNFLTPKQLLSMMSRLVTIIFLVPV